uniref:Uncharacterized protein n=1 Tax=Arundo donax TaxID=35708 RepID=A0A0A9FYX2_ARUDO
MWWLVCRWGISERVVVGGSRPRLRPLLRRRDRQEQRSEKGGTGEIDAI